MSVIMLIESEKKAECYDCGKKRKIHGVQVVVRIVVNEELDDSIKVPPLPSGRFWAPTCRRCYRELVDLGAGD